ncbi:uncharacterized protein LOC126764623 [Bactrocera neohumeralis]|uniref:uncharacterized protein LOC126764623 n=1 Tax=Bactrocera neohumeralis TaxID=98809 RepID=UPI002165E475|nr:uncharacterized protein LOC126764623 [Bactrocera neohumeralis]
MSRYTALSWRLAAAKWYAVLRSARAVAKRIALHNPAYKYRRRYSWRNPAFKIGQPQVFENRYWPRVYNSLDKITADCALNNRKRTAFNDINTKSKYENEPKQIFEGSEIFQKDSNGARPFSIIKDKQQNNGNYDELIECRVRKPTKIIRNSNIKPEKDLRVSEMDVSEKKTQSGEGLIASNGFQASYAGTKSSNKVAKQVSRELERERAYDITHLQQQVQTNVPLLNEQQSSAYNQLINAVDSGNGGIFFLNAPGGTGKTLLLALILAAIRGQGGIALALASTGISATLLEGGRMAHSALKLPLNLQIHESPVCNISKQSAMAQVLKKCKLIIWDEITMAHKRSLEALDRTLRDLRNNNRCFGGVMILLSGDFR